MNKIKLEVKDGWVIESINDDSLALKTLHLKKGSALWIPDIQGISYHVTHEEDFWEIIFYIGGGVQVRILSTPQTSYKKRLIRIITGDFNPLTIFGIR